MTFEMFFFYFSEKTSLDISCELSAWQTIHMKFQDLFSLKNKKSKKMLSATVMTGTLRVNLWLLYMILNIKRQGVANSVFTL